MFAFMSGSFAAFLQQATRFPIVKVERLREIRRSAQPAGWVERSETLANVRFGSHNP
jgi:hypothetical protein